MADIGVKELSSRLQAGDRPVILDVRNPDEYAICQIDGSILIPLGELSQRIGELDPKAEIVVHCKMGGRSRQACAFLAKQGFADVKNLAGGILAWAREVDPSMKTY